MPTNTPFAPRPDHDGDNIAAVPLVKDKRPFNWLYLTPLLLLLLIPFCNRRDTTRDATTTTVTPAPAAVATATPVALAAPARDTTDRPANTSRNAGAVVLNPFAVNTTGPDVGKAVLNFEANATTPNTDAATVLANIVAYLRANPAARVSLRGYTDNSGSAETNRALTEKRIEGVKGALATAGVDAARIAAANFGEAYAVTDNSTAQAREMNRRVEVELAK